MSTAENTSKTPAAVAEPERFDLRSHQIATDKQAELLRLFPESRTEGGKIDFDRLKLALGQTVDVGKERYGMNWPGKADLRCATPFPLPLRSRCKGGDPRQHPHLDHGYAVTSHSSQGQIADRVLIHVDTELGAKDLLNNRMAYVAVSRGAYDAQIFTNDREKLGAALGHDVSHSSAHAPEMKPEQKQEQAVTPQREIAPEQEQSLDIGLGL